MLNIVISPKTFEFKDFGFNRLQNIFSTSFNSIGRYLTMKIIVLNDIIHS
ncbi:hypothetical protein FHT22_001431 [Pedobacter sp. SG918]|nr:hypothetical protein [Pedobacter sp. SG918]